MVRLKKGRKRKQGTGFMKKKVERKNPGKRSDPGKIRFHAGQTFFKRKNPGKTGKARRKR